MNLELNIKVSNFLENLKNDSLIQEYIEQKKKVLENKDLLKKVEKIQEKMKGDL